jgi:hypothetical protein
LRFKFLDSVGVYDLLDYIMHLAGMVAVFARAL